MRLRGRRRRWMMLVAVVLFGSGVVGAGFWFLFVPHWRPDLRDGEVYGIDVSAHQGRVDWERVAGDEIRFVYIKATEGGDFTDDRFAQNWDGAAEAGLERGAYHFFTLCRPGADQARHFLRVAPPDTDALPPAVDLELAGNCAARPERRHVESEVRDFLDAVEREWGRETILYVGDDWEHRYPVREQLERPLWHRRFLRRPNVDGWVIWQLHGYARVEGVTGGVDLNVMRRTDLETP